MLKIEINNVKKYFADRLILNIENLKVYEGDRIGIVGVNGSGKSTLINMILGNELPDEGVINVKGKINYVSQLGFEEQEEINLEMASKLGIKPQYSETLSGGEKVKYKIATVFAKKGDILLADEPTANLDLKGVEFIQQEFLDFNGAILSISHDREFLDKLCNKIWEIENGEIKQFNGNYTDYYEEKIKAREREKFEYNQYVSEKNRLITAVIEFKEKSASIKRAPKRMGNSEARLHKMGGQKSKAKLDRAAKAIESRIDRLEKKEKPKELSSLNFDIQKTEGFYSKVPIVGNEFNINYQERVIFKDADFKLKKGSKVALIGENGSGKTTLIRCIINESNGIKIANRVRIGYFAQGLDILNENDNILENIMNTSIYNETFVRILLSRLGIRLQEVYKKVEILSGGERVKVCLCKLFTSDNNLLILDEPTNYLDIYAMEVLEEALKSMDKTMIIVSHDRRFLENMCTELWILENNKITTFYGSLDKYKNIKIPVDIAKREKEERKLILKNKLAEIISLLSIEKNDEKKIDEFNYKYEEILKELKNIDA